MALNKDEQETWDTISTPPEPEVQIFDAEMPDGTKIKIEKRKVNIPARKMKTGKTLR